MTTTPTPARGLSTPELESIRETLAGGRKPKVMFTEAAGQIAGQTGQVVKLADPEQSDEWLLVRFGRDELPFSPTDLAIPPKGRAMKRPAAEPAPPPVPIPHQPYQENAMKPSDSLAPEAPAKISEPASVSKPAKAAKRAAKSKPAPGLTVTLAYTAGEWTVAAQQGNKTLAKPYLIKPAEALKMVGMLDVPGVQEAVEQIVTAERNEAEQQAEKLRVELAEVEARLAELRDAG